MMTRQSMARVTSASTEADFAPGTIPFDWEAAPGRPGRKSIKSGNTGAAARRCSLEVPSLPLPPGKRPNDSPDVQSEVKLESEITSSQPRKLFNLKFPGSPKKSPSTSRMRLPFQSSSKPPKEILVDEDHSFSIFNPVSGHRFGSSLTRRMLDQLKKKKLLWKRCLPPTPERSSHMDQCKGRRLDSVDEGYVTAADSPVSGPSLSSAPGHGLANWRNSLSVVTKHIQPSSSQGHGSRHSSNSSPMQLLQPSSPSHGHSSNSSPVETKQVQVASSRFMASMLISLCPEADDSDEPHVDAVDEIADNFNDDNRSSSPEVLYETPSECSEIVVDPTSQTMLSQEECRCTCKHHAYISARVDLSTPQVNQRSKKSRSVSRSLHEELATARSSSEHLRSEKLVQHQDFANRLAQNIVAEQKDNWDAYPVFFKASSNRELMPRREPYHSSFSWKPCTENSRPSQEPATDLASDIAQEPGDSEFAKEIFEVDVGEKYERRGGNRSLARDFSPDSCNSSFSPDVNWRHNTVRSRPNPSRPSISKDVDVPMSKSKSGAPHSMDGYLSPPRTSSGVSEYSISSRDKPKAFVRWKSTIEPSILRKSPLEGRSERNQPPATRATVNFLSPPRRQALQQNAIPGRIRVEDRKQTMKSSSQRRIPLKARKDDTDDSDDDSECSTDSSRRSAVSSSNSASPKPASYVLPENLLRSPSLLKFKLERQQNHRESLSLPHMVDQETALPGPSFYQVLLARSHSVRTSRVFTRQECSDGNARGPDLPPASRLAKTSSSVMSKVALYEAKAGEESSRKSAPLYRFNQRAMCTTSTAVPSYKLAAR